MAVALLTPATRAVARIDRSYTGRPLRVIRNPYSVRWASNGPELQALLRKGVIPYVKDRNDGTLGGDSSSGPVRTGTPSASKGSSGGMPAYGDSWRDVRTSEAFNPTVDAVPVGQAAGAITTVMGAGEVVDSRCSRRSAA